MAKKNTKRANKAETKPETTNNLESLKDLGIAAAAAAQEVGGGLHVSVLARLGVEPTEEQYAAIEADPSTDWLLVMAVQLRNQVREAALAAPSYVRARFARPSVVAEALAARTAYLCGVELR